MKNAKSIFEKTGVLALVVTLLSLTGCEDPKNTQVEAKTVIAQNVMAAADPADWCAGHGVPESMCTICNPGLVEKFKQVGDWCAEHGLPESVCPECNPGLGEQTAGTGDWCTEHAIPESMCTLCNPGLVEKFKNSGNWCEEHGFPESVCPICNPVVPDSTLIVPGMRIRFRSPSIEQAAGIETVPAEGEAMALELECTARIDFDRNRMADIRSPVPSIVREVLVDLGQKVSSGDKLFHLESAKVGNLQEHRIAAIESKEAAQANLMRQQKLREEGIASQRQVELARQEFKEAEAELNSIDQSLRISGASSGDRTGLFAVYVPITGTVVRRPAMVGTYAGESISLATVANTAVMWAMLDVSEWDAASVQVGQEVEVEVDGITGRTFYGKITWISSEVDPRTRTVTSRAEVENIGGMLRAGQFARATISVSPREGAVSVPVQSVQRVGEQSVVFLRTSEGLYEPKIALLGRSDGRRVQISGEIMPGDPVVTTGAYLLRTELSRESIGAGCCEIEPPGGNR